MKKIALVLAMLMTLDAGATGDPVAWVRYFGSRSSNPAGTCTTGFYYNTAVPEWRMCVNGVWTAVSGGTISGTTNHVTYFSSSIALGSDANLTRGSSLLSTSTTGLGVTGSGAGSFGVVINNGGAGTSDLFVGPQSGNFGRVYYDGTTDQMILNAAPNQMIFQLSAVEKMRLASTGVNVTGVAQTTNSPVVVQDGQLNIVGNGTDGIDVTSATSAFLGVEIRNTNATGQSRIDLGPQSGGKYGALIFDNTDNTFRLEAAGASATGLRLRSANGSGIITFEPGGNVEAGRFTSAGHFTVGSTSAAGLFNVGTSNQFQVDSAGAVTTTSTYLAQTTTGTDDQIQVGVTPGGGARHVGTITARDLTGDKQWYFPNQIGTTQIGSTFIPVQGGLLANNTTIGLIPGGTWTRKLISANFATTGTAGSGGATGLVISVNSGACKCTAPCNSSPFAVTCTGTCDALTNAIVKVDSTSDCAVYPTVAGNVLLETSTE